MKKLCVPIDVTVYSLQAIRNTCYDFSDHFIFEIHQEGRNCLIEVIAKVSSDDLVLQEFWNALLDHQVRLDTQEEYKVIRDLLVAQAFAPCENLKDVISCLKP